MSVPRAHRVIFLDNPPENCRLVDPPNGTSQGPLEIPLMRPWRMPTGSHVRDIVHYGRQCRMCKSL